MQRLQFLVPALVLTFAACSQPEAPTGPATPTAQDGLTLNTATAERMTGSFVDKQGRTVRFDAAKVRDELYLDVRGNDGREILHVDTTPGSYEFSYLGGRLKLHASKDVVAKARAEEPGADASSDEFVFDGDMHVLDEMMQLPEIAALPHLSRALGVRGFTGRDFPSTMALHKIAQQSAKGLGIEVESLEVQSSSQEGYCTAYPNRSNRCLGMCGPDCKCWSWVCGDCCYHGGCAKHDSWCNQGKWYYCYNITAVIALFGC